MAMSDKSEKWLSQFAKGQREIFRLLILSSQQSETQQYSIYRDTIHTKSSSSSHLGHLKLQKENI